MILSQREKNQTKKQKTKGGRRELLEVMDKFMSLMVMMVAQQWEFT